MSQSQAVVLLSGGIDSAVLLSHAKDLDWRASALSIDYGQKHVRELQAAKDVAAAAGIPWKLISLGLDIRGLLFPEGHLLDRAGGPGAPISSSGFTPYVVPNRNMLLIALAGAYAMREKATIIAYGAHGGDQADFPDCRPAFVLGMQKVFEGLEISLEAPFLEMSKAEVIEKGALLGVPFHLTWSCYAGGDKHCGKCPTCIARKEAFTLAGVKDPTLYAA